MDKEGTADISPMARFGVTEAFVAEKLYNGLVSLYKVEHGKHTHETQHQEHGHGDCVFIEQARKQFHDGEGKVDWDKVEAKWAELRKTKVSLGNKYFTKEVSQKARQLPR